MEGPVFDAAGKRLAYTILADPGHQINGLHAWAIYVLEMTTGTETVFGGPFLARPHERPLPGEPIAWRDSELLLNTHVYLAEDSNRGVWTIDMSEADRGEMTLLQHYDRQVLGPEDVSPRSYWRPTISPDGDWLAFLVHDYDYGLPCLDSDRYREGLVVALGVVGITGGELRTLVDATSDRSMLADLLAWSPKGQEVLFAQGRCEGESAPFESVLRAVDLHGNITGEWPSARIETAWWGEALWCTPDDVFYTRTSSELWHLNLTTGQSEHVLSGEWMQLVGCLP